MAHAGLMVLRNCLDGSSQPDPRFGPLHKRLGHFFQRFKDRRLRSPAVHACSFLLQILTFLFFFACLFGAFGKAVSRQYLDLQDFQ